MARFLNDRHLLHTWATIAGHWLCKCDQCALFMAFMDNWVYKNIFEYMYMQIEFTSLFDETKSWFAEVLNFATYQMSTKIQIPCLPALGRYNNWSIHFHEAQQMNMCQQSLRIHCPDHAIPHKKFLWILETQIKFMIAKGAAYLRVYSMSYKLELAGPESFISSAKPRLLLIVL